ncbi:hypothetical protein ACINNAV82_2767 [Acinetobacter baumannii Naval-82]|nr:hypothetical protein ACINNAV82_2767 [Acinetobacter baumannii Naval-82]
MSQKRNQCHVHGGIRHLEMSTPDQSQCPCVHGGIRHLEIQ